MNQVPKYLWIVLSVFLAVLSLRGLGWLDNQGPKGQVSVTGTGEVAAVPDIAEVSLTVQAEAKSAKQVQSLSAEKSRALQEFCEKQGIPKKDLQTSQYRLEPVYFYVENKAPQLSGFRLTQTLKVTLRDLDKIGDVIAGGVEAGANQVDGPVFSVDKKDELLKEAREKAFASARELAREQAAAAGVDLGRVIGFSEGFGGIPYVDTRPRLAKMAVAEASVPAIEAGSEKIVVTATLVYELK